LNSRLSKIYEGEIRHVLAPQLKYDLLSAPTVDRERLTNIESPDDLERSSQLTLSLEQKLQTRKNQQYYEGSIQDLARLLMTSGYNFKAKPGGELTTTKLDLELRPTDSFMIDADTQYDPPSKDFLQFNLDLHWAPSKGPQWTFGHRYLQDDSVQETLELKTKLTSKWDFRTYQRFHFKSSREDGTKRINDFVEQEYTIVRDLHCWEAELNYNIGTGHEFWIIFRLKNFEDILFSLKQKAYSPSPGVETTSQLPSLP
jgi:hypothetical protein